MSKVDEIERAVEQLPLSDFILLATRIERRRQDLENRNVPSVGARDHSAFLNSYAPEDEGLYDDAKAG
jgi:hypothetical protein